jgi:hypothetical protein
LIAAAHKAIAVSHKELFELVNEPNAAIDEIEKAHAYEDEAKKVAMEATDRAEVAQSELKKARLELHFLKQNKRLPSDLDEKGVELLSQEIRNDLSWLDVSKVIPRPEFPAAEHFPDPIAGGVFRMSQDIRDYAREQGAKFGDPRSMNMVYKFALYFAVDLGLSEITEDCVTRALALVDYRQKAMAFLEPIEARNDEGRLLKEIQREIRQHGGKMTTRELDRALHSNEYGSRFWDMVY